MRDIHQISQSSKGITTRLTSLGHILYVGLGISLFCIIFTLFCSSTFADYSTTSTASVRVTPTCYMSATVTSAHSASLINGVYSADTTEYSSGIGKTMIRTNCNDPSGYAIYAVGFTGNSYTSDNHTKLVGNITGSTISTGVYNSSTTNNSLWSMKVNSINDSSVSDGVASIENGYSNYSLVPSNFTKVASYNTVTDQSLGNVIETTYAAYIDLNQNADIYTGQVKYVLVHPNSYVAGSYNIAYNANGGTGTMTEETDIDNFEGHNLAANGFTAPAGTLFGGWCTTNTDMFSCNDGMIYQPGETVYSLGSANTTVNLYAYWQPTTPMQNYTQTQCNSLAIGSSDYAYDTRDNHIYKISRLADGKCWMTQSLDLAGGTALYSGTSDVPAGYTSTPYYTLPASAVKNSDNANLTDSTQFSSDSGEYVFNSNNIALDDSGCGGSKPCNSYYSWLTATAGGRNSSGTSVTGNGYNAAYSICPAGWHLPTATTEGVARDNGGYTGGEFYQMLNQYGLTTGYYYAGADTTPLGSTVFNNIKDGTVPDFLRAGYYDSGTFRNGGSGGGYWSSTSYNSAVACDFGFDSITVTSARNGSRRYGFSVRCVHGD